MGWHFSPYRPATGASIPATISSMPPRFAYWTILIDNQPTSFRAREREELLPTLNQLLRKNATAVMKWFARGRLWETQEAEREDFQKRKRAGAPGFGHRYDAT